jgi:glycosyltransferase involved in cell wall biosynthesis
MKISIAIPVRNGATYLENAVLTALDAVGSDGEVVVSLNGCSDSSAAICSAIKDSRLVVLVPEKRLSMTANFEFLLSRLRGEWVVFIGHDDAVLPNLRILLSQIEKRKKNIEVVSFKRAYFFWPGVERVYGPARWQFSGRRIASERSSKVALFSVLMGFRSYADLPSVYANSLVKMSLIRRLKFNGKFFSDTSPDVFSSAAIVLSTKSFIHCDVPCIWIGSSPDSNGASISQAMLGEHLNHNQKQRTDNFFQESALDGYFLAPIIESVPFYLRNTYQLFLSAVWNFKARPSWLSDEQILRLSRQNLFLDKAVRAQPERHGLAKVDDHRILRLSLKSALLCMKSLEIARSALRMFSSSRFHVSEEIANGSVAPIVPGMVNDLLENRGFLSERLVFRRLGLSDCPSSPIFSSLKGN